MERVCKLPQNEEIVYITDMGKKYHRKNCHTLKSSKIEKLLSEVDGKYSACKTCFKSDVNQQNNKYNIMLKNHYELEKQEVNKINLKAVTPNKNENSNIERNEFPKQNLKPMATQNLHSNLSKPRENNSPVHKIFSLNRKSTSRSRNPSNDMKQNKQINIKEINFNMKNLEYIPNSKNYKKHRLYIFNNKN